MKMFSQLLKMALPSYLDWIADLIEDIADIALEASNGWSEKDEELIRSKVKDFLIAKVKLPEEEALLLGSAAALLGKQIAYSRPLRKRRFIR